MTVRKVLIVGITFVVMIEFVNKMAIGRLSRELERVKREMKLLNERKCELLEMKEFVERVRGEGVEFPLLQGPGDWVRAYVHDLIHEIAKESNIKVQLDMGEIEASGFFPKILNINQIPVTITLESQPDFFTFAGFVKRLRESRFFIDSLSIEGGEFSMGAPTVYVKFFYRGGHVGKA